MSNKHWTRQCSTATAITTGLTHGRGSAHASCTMWYASHSWRLLFCTRATFPCIVGYPTPTRPAPPCSIGGPYGIAGLEQALQPLREEGWRVQWIKVLAIGKSGQPSLVKCLTKGKACHTLCNIHINLHCHIITPHDFNEVNARLTPGASYQHHNFHDCPV